MGIKTGRHCSETEGNGGRFYWKPSSTTSDCSVLGGRGEEEVV
jgi:hypothetical protein